MPTYDYRCDACGHCFERVQSITAAPLRRCPECGKRKAKRLLSTGVGLIFKGSGFYATDYRSAAYKEAAKKDAPAPAAAESPCGKCDADPKTCKAARAAGAARGAKGADAAKGARGADAG